MRQRRRALSEVISTTILVAAMLIIVIGVMGFAIDLFNIQTQEAEFSQAQNGVVVLAQSIDSILPTQGAAAFSSFNARSGGPNLITNFDKMTVTLSSTCNINTNGSVIFNNTIPINEFRYRAGSLVSQEGQQWLRAGNFTGLPFSSTFSKTLIIENNSAPLGFVYTSHDNGSTWVTMDFRRVNVNNLGIFDLSLGAIPSSQDPAGNLNYTPNIQPIDLVQVNLVNITGGTFTGSSNIVVTALNQGTKSATLIQAPPCQGSSQEGNYYVKLSVALNQAGWSLPISVPDSVSVPGSTTPEPVTTVVEVYVTNIQLSFGGG